VSAVLWVPGRRRALVAAATLLLAGLVADALVASPRPARAVPVPPAQPSLAASGALSSSWFCPAMTASSGRGADSPADGRVIVANTGAAPLTGTLTSVPSQGDPKQLSLSVPPETRVVVRLGDVTPAPFAAATVVLDGPEGAVEEGVRSPLGESIAPCATAGSDHWYFAAGSTDRDATMLLSIYNPYAGDAIADLRFLTDTGPAAPARLQGIVVPGRHLSVVNVGDYVRRRVIVSSALTLRRGRVVVTKIQLDSAPVQGLSLTLGAPAPGLRWYYPDGVSTDTVDERIELLNPTDREARVQLALTIERAAPLEPFQVVVAPRNRLTVAFGNDSRVPRGVAHGTVVFSANGVPFVAERVMTASPASGHTGLADSMGSARSSTRWVFVAGAVNEFQDEWIVLLNPGAVPARVSVGAFGTGTAAPVEGLSSVDVAAGGRVALRIGDHLMGGVVALDLSSSAPVVAERALFRLGTSGISGTIGIAGPPTSATPATP